MEDFISNFRQFKDWLYYREAELEGFCEEQGEICEVIAKFEELGLDNAF